MEKPAQNIQDSFLNNARKDKTAITLYLLSGVKLSGRIKSFDKYSLILETNNQEQLIFKHAISTVVIMKAGHAFAATWRCTLLLRPRVRQRPHTRKLRTVDATELPRTSPASRTARAILAAVEWKSRRASSQPSHRLDAEESLEELRELAVSAGATVVDTVLQIREAPEAATLVGAGKVRELAAHGSLLSTRI